MKAQIKVTELTHNDLVNIFSTALYGCDFFTAEWDRSFYEAIPSEKKNGECYEDKIADVLLNGGKIRVIDYYADGELNKGAVKCWLDENENGMYEITLEDMLKGCSTDEGYSLAKELIIDEEGDYYTANNLLQIIMFGEEVY